jgi:hypothetical protein
VHDDVVVRPLSPQAPLRHIVAATAAGAGAAPAAVAMLEILVDVARRYELGVAGGAPAP